ncbi:MAG TPA: hypothetical protein VK688_04170 [Gemmatimonadales bacterium]|nr:hypothetical protein [Gemmatimonadales bacterium]
MRATLYWTPNPTKEHHMMKTLCLAAVLAVMACAGEKKADAPASSEAPAAAPAAGGMDSTMHHDSTMARDTSKKM